MRTFIAILIASSSLTLFSACTHPRVVPQGQAAATNDSQGKGLRLELSWVKQKKNKLDLDVIVTNSYSQTVSFNRSSWKVTYNGVDGEVVRYAMPSEIGPGQTEHDTVTIKFPRSTEIKAQGVITIDPVFTQSADQAQRTHVAPLKYNFSL